MHVVVPAGPGSVRPVEAFVVVDGDAILVRDPFIHFPDKAVPLGDVDCIGLKVIREVISIR